MWSISFGVRTQSNDLIPCSTCNRSLVSSEIIGKGSLDLIEVNAEFGFV
jgi:hypothetical protein